MKRSQPLRKRRKISGPRMKPVRVRPMSAAEKRHAGRLKRLGCLVAGKSVTCPCYGRLTIHHVRSDGHQGVLRDHTKVVPLCLAHHQHDWSRYNVERLGHGAFNRFYGVDLLAEAERLWAESQELERRAA